MLRYFSKVLLSGKHGNGQALTGGTSTHQYGRDFIILCLFLPLTACEIQPEKTTEVPPPIQAQAPTSEMDSASSADNDADIQALFAQKRIDPLTDYLNTHQGDKNKAEQVARVLQERDQRCEKIAAWHLKKAPTQENLDRLKGGYAYSCQSLIETFTQRVAEVQRTQTPNNQAIASAPKEAEPVPEAVAAETPKAEKTQNDVAKLPPPVVTQPAPAPMIEQKKDCQQAMQQKNFAKILDACPKKAQKGLLQAQLTLAKMYADGKGVAQNDQQAVQWYRLAAEQGDKTAQSALGVYYYTGNGVQQNYRQAAQWQHKAAQQGYPEAQFILGVMYELGQGVPQDFVLAYQWFLLATAQGAKGAMASRASLAAKLSPAQIQEGQKLARQWSGINQ